MIATAMMAIPPAKQQKGALKDARMEFKTTEDLKNLLTQAAALNGLDLTAFVMNAATERAVSVIREHSTLTLSAQGQARFQALLDTPPAPSASLRELMRLPDFPAREP